MPKAKFTPKPNRPAPSYTQRNAVRMLGVMRKSMAPYVLDSLHVSYKLAEILERTESDHPLHRAATQAKNILDYKLRTASCTDCTRKGAANRVFKVLMELMLKKDSHTDKIWLEVFPNKPFIKYKTEQYLFRSDQQELEARWNKFVGETKNEQNG